MRIVMNTVKNGLKCQTTDVRRRIIVCYINISLFRNINIVYIYNYI